VKLYSAKKVNCKIKYPQRFFP